MSFQIKPVSTFPYQIQPGLETWRLIDLRSGETVDELPRTAIGGICSSFNYGQLKGKAAELTKKLNANFIVRSMRTNAILDFFVTKEEANSWIESKNWPDHPFAKVEVLTYNV